MKTILAVIGGLVVMMVILVMFIGVGKNIPDSNANNKIVDLPFIDKQSDDYDELRSQYTDEYFKSNYWNRMVEVEYGLGKPDKVVKFAEYGCTLPALVAIYNYADAAVLSADKLGYDWSKGAVALEYRNLHCQSDLRAYKLKGIHPLSGQWSKKIGLR